MELRLFSTDLGLTGFISIINIDTDNKIFNIIESVKIEIEDKSLKVLKIGKTEPIVKNQISFSKNKDFIEVNSWFKKNKVLGLMEQITTRPFQSAISAMSLNDSFAVFRSIYEQTLDDYIVIPPATWKKKLNITKDKKTSKDLFDKLVSEKSITIESHVKTLLKKIKNHNQVESVLIAYFYYTYLIENLNSTTQKT